MAGSGTTKSKDTGSSKTTTGGASRTDGGKAKQPSGKAGSKAKRTRSRTPPPTSEVRVERNIYRRVNRDGTPGSFRAVGAGDTKRSFPTLDAAREFRDRERELTVEQRESLKPDLVIDRELVEGVLLYLERNDQLASSTVNGYRKTARYSLYPWIDPEPDQSHRRHRWTTRTLTTKQLDEWCSSGTASDPAAYTNRVKLALVLCRTLVKANMRTDNPAHALETRTHVRSPKTIRSRSERTTRSGELLWIPTYPDLIDLVSGMPELYRLWFMWLALTGMRPSEAAGMRWDEGHIQVEKQLLLTPERPMVEQNVGYWACGGVSVLDPDFEAQLDRRIARGKTTAKTPHSAGRRVPLLKQLAEDVIEPLREFRPPDGTPWLFPGRLTSRALNTYFGSVPLSYNYAQVKLHQRTKDTPLHGLQQYELRHFFASVLLHAAVSYTQVSEYLGNSEAEVRRTYSHLLQGQAGEVSERASKIVSGDGVTAPTTAGDTGN